jgi:zinc ribbon protein
MYCDTCGTPLSEGARFCSSCGKRIAGSVAPGTTVAVSAVADDRVRRHIQPLAILWLVNGILRLGEVAWLMIFGSLVLPGWHWFLGPNMRMPFGWSLESLLWKGLYAAGVSLALFGLVHLVLAWGLFEREPWARMLGIVIGILALFRFPLGTALGIYTLWVLLPESSGREYERMSTGPQVSAARASF